MKILSILIAALFATAAHAGTKVMTDPAGNEIRLLDAPCTATAGVFSAMPPQLRPDFKAAAVRWNGQDFEACWSEYDANHYFIVDESGDQGAIPKGAFKEDLAV